MWLTYYVYIYVYIYFLINIIGDLWTFLKEAWKIVVKDHVEIIVGVFVYLAFHCFQWNS